MRRRSLWQGLFYRMEYVGEAEKDGKVVKKYRKVARFPKVNKSDILTYAIIIILTIFAAVFLASVAGSTKLKSYNTNLHAR
jgi:hypothetical protein